MKYKLNVILVIFICSRINSENKIVPAAYMLPILTNITSINSTAIGFFYVPSPSIKEMNISQFNGGFTVTGTVFGKRLVATACTVFMMENINKTGKIIIDHLEANAIYQVCFHTTWHEANTTIDCLDMNNNYKRHCQLLRTFMTGNINLNDFLNMIFIECR